MNKVSIIIPIYNTEQYLEKCLHSICNQTYTNLEIICVDDGSTDESGKIAERFAEKDNRCIVYHKSNGGESSARNMALKIASGDYIGFVDCDDWIEPKMYESLVHELITYDVDLVASGWYKDTITESIAVGNDLPVTLEMFGRDELLKYIYQRDAYQGFAYMWNKLYKRELIFLENSQRIFFQEDLHLGGDVLFLAEIALNTQKARYIDKCFYHYFQREQSGCHTKNIDTRLDWLKAYELIIEKFEKEQIPNEILVYVKRFLAYHSANVAELALEQKNRKAFLTCKNIMSLYRKEYESTNIQYPERLKRFFEILDSKID